MKNIKKILLFFVLLFGFVVTVGVVVSGNIENTSINNSLKGDKNTIDKILKDSADKMTSHNSDRVSITKMLNGYISETEDSKRFASADKEWIAKYNTYINEYNKIKNFVNGVNDDDTKIANELRNLLSNTEANYKNTLKIFNIFLSLLAVAFGLSIIIKFIYPFFKANNVRLNFLKVEPKSKK